MKQLTELNPNTKNVYIRQQNTTSLEKATDTSLNFSSKENKEI
jgi:regulator of sirC expression with transglutaminase-like and TPR domain